MVSEAFCKSISIIQNLLVFYLSSTKNMYLSIGSYEILIGIYIGLCYLLDVP